MDPFPQRSGEFRTVTTADHGSYAQQTFSPYRGRFEEGVNFVLGLRIYFGGHIFPGVGMNLEFEILKDHSTRQALRIERWIGSDTRRFKRLMELFLNGEYRVVQRAARIISGCVQKDPDLVKPWLSVMVGKMQEPGAPDAVKRNVLRVLQHVEIPSYLLSTLIPFCFKELASAKSPIAVKAFAMTVLANAAKRKPDITPELRSILQQLAPGASPGLRVRSRNVLRIIGEDRG